MHKYKEKLSERKGFTIAETLVVLIIVMLVGVVIAGGVRAAADAYTKAVKAANAQVLLSTAATELRNELGTATRIQTVSSQPAQGQDPTTYDAVEYLGSQTGYGRIYNSDKNPDNSTDPASSIRISTYRIPTETVNGYSTAPYIVNNEEPSLRKLVTKSASTGILYVTYEGVIYDASKKEVTFNGLKVVEKDKGSALAGPINMIIHVYSLDR